MKKKHEQPTPIPQDLTYEEARQILINAGDNYAEVLKENTIKSPTAIKIWTKKVFGRRKKR